MAFKSQRPKESSAEPARSKSLMREYGEALVIALALALIIRAFLVQAFSIPSGSMQPTLLIGDYLLVNKFSYGIRNPFTNKVVIPVSEPKRGDVVVFIFPQDPGKDYIKRVVGLPGDEVRLRNKKVYINGKLLDMPQAVNTDPLMLPPPRGPLDSARDNFGPVTVPPGAYFVMGDNRDHSYDSRFWGFVPQDALRGKAFIIYFSWEGAQGASLPQAFADGVKGLFTKMSWDAKAFRIRWDRLGQLIN